AEWKDLEQLDWHLLSYPNHEAFFRYIRKLNHFYKNEPALWERDRSSDGFRWISPHDREQSVISFLRRGYASAEELIIVCNFTPVVRQQYRIGVPQSGVYREIFNSDDEAYGGSGVA